MSEKGPNKEKEEKSKASNYVGINTSHELDDRWEEDEVYTLGENRYQPYVAKGKTPIGWSETRWENRLRNRDSVGQLPLENVGSTTDTIMEGEFIPVGKPRRKRMDTLKQNQEDWDRESVDTFDEFTYEGEELEEKEGYLSMESADEELNLYDNPEGNSPTTIKEKEWLLSMVDLECDDEENKQPDPLDEEEVGDEPTEEYQELMEEIDREFTRVLTWSEYDDGKPVAGVEFSDDDSDWDNDLPCEARTGLGAGEAWWEIDDNKNDYNQGWEDDERDVLMINEVIDEQERDENHLPESVVKALNEYRSRAPRCGPITSPLPDPAEKKFCVEEYDEELRKQEAGDLTQTRTEGNDHANPELTEADTPGEEENELWYGSIGKENVALTTEEESEVFVALINEDDDKTVQEEENLPEPPAGTSDTPKPRTPSVWYRRLIISGARQESVRREYFFATGIDLGYGELIDVEAVKTQLRRDRRVITLEPSDSIETMKLCWEGER
ncbi:18226_t:CDS:2 [Gigaspora margarita]|uniref:18226_t:CDS:1 n=1 Tax=Gigaspora margarita TaxID=4874 RepID=A0ABM8VVJ1_GIGMA|nr:18226_t:CDS:2 [Gigaspora margarita]